MGIAENETELAQRAATFLKVEMKRAKVTYEGMAEKLAEHGLTETRDSVAAKLKRGTFAATFFIACVAALELQQIDLQDII